MTTTPNDPTPVTVNGTNGHMLTVGPHDVLVIRFDQTLNHQEAAKAAEQMTKVLGRGRLMILDRSATVAVLRDTQWVPPAGAPTFPMIGVPGEH